ncbi:MAG: adenylate/guanylate cyclase domain-containing protein [Ilumatobacteraceae bacterium]
MHPDVGYARSGKLSIANQVVGEGPPDVVFIPEWFNNLEAQWDHPRLARFPARLASFARVIMLNQRGMGLSDPISLDASMTAEDWIDDVRTVMDAVGVERVCLIGTGTAGTMAMLLAATQPDRVSRLVLVNSTARTAADDDYPFGSSPEMRASMRDLMADAWGRAAILPMLAPELADDEEFRDWYGRFERLAASPGMALAAQRMVFDLDVRNALGAIQCPTLIVHRTGDPLITVEHGRYLAQHVAGAKYVELDGDGHAYWSGDSDRLLAEIQTFLTGAPGQPDTNRVLATVLFTDIVGSTELATRLGDRRWAALLGDHHRISRAEFVRFRGHEVDAAGDGFLAMFDGPARAIRCASAIRDALRGLGIEIRAGLHTGEVEARGESIIGIGVHIGARVMASAQPGEVLVSRTVVDLVAGSEIAFRDRGRHALKGVDGRWQLFAVDTDALA